MAFIYRHHRTKAQEERHHETLIAAIEDATGDRHSGDAFPGDIVSDTGEVILNQRNLLLCIGFSERWIAEVICAQAAAEGAPE